MTMSPGTRDVYTTRWFRLVEKTAEASNAPFYWIDSPDCVTVLAVTADGTVPLVRQYRPALDRMSLELPSGHIDRKDKSRESAAKRELLEETGYEAPELKFLGAVDPDTGRLRARIWCYFAPNAVKVAESKPGGEKIENRECTLSELDSMMSDGRMSHAQDMAVVLLARLRGFI
ncbi:MAG: NUDIX hydrolase [Bryobacteraceae bacterium]